MLGVKGLVILDMELDLGMIKALSYDDLKFLWQRIFTFLHRRDLVVDWTWFVKVERRFVLDCHSFELGWAGSYTRVKNVVL